MSVIARLEVIPTRETSYSNAVASAVEALDGFDVSYETTATDTILEADDVSDVFAAAEAAHRAVGDDRVITSLEVDELRTRTQNRHERVASVERELGRPAKRERQESVTNVRQQGELRSEPRQGGKSKAEVRRYRGPVRTDTGRRSATQATESQETTSRYLQSKRPTQR